MNKVIIDERMRRIEKEKIKELGYEIIELKQSLKTYPEISSHVDIFVSKIGNKIIVEPSQYINMNGISAKIGSELGEKYPDDIKYNVCTIGKKAIHNFSYTDSTIKQELIEQNYELINTTQGYTNCSIAVVDENKVIVTDKGLYKILEKHKIEVLYIKDELDIKLLNENQYSTRKGFIGGAISKLGEKVIVFGDLNKIDPNGEIRKFIGKEKIIEFENLDIIDYGGIVEIND